MKQIIKVRIFNYILALLGFAGSASCDGIIPDMRCEYGTPTMDYEVSGKVVDQSNQPIPGIKVSYRNLHHPSLLTVYTSADGSFSVSSHSEGGPVIKFEDVDGPDNGGEFAEKVERRKVNKVQDGDGHWYQGKFEAKDVVIRLEEKK